MPGDDLTPWHDLEVKFKIGTLFGKEIQIGINKLFNGIFNSQSNLQQMQEASVNLAGVVIYSIENLIAKGLLERNIASSGKINLMNPDKLKELAEGKNIYEWTKKTMDALINNPKPPAGIGNASARFKFISSMQDFDEADADTVHGILILEGLHTLCNDPMSPTAEDDFNMNYEDFKQRYNIRIFAVNIPHMQPFQAANHAFGMQFIRPELFYPTDSGFTAWGKRLIKKLYEDNVLIDFKHMSLFTRKQLIAEKNNQGFSDFPLICTHAGLTGIHSDKRYKYLITRPKESSGEWRLRHLKTKGKVPDSCFNLSSINLYDEEIVDIINSNGLIGISLDQRILGFPVESVTYILNDTPYDQEFISGAEKEYFLRGYDANTVDAIKAADDCVLSGDEAQVHGENSFEFHYYYFLNQVFHILAVAKAANISLSRAIKSICLGSDFDGLINALDCCKNVGQLQEFKDHLRHIITRRPTFWRELDIQSNEVDADELLDGIFFTNAKDFLKKHFV